MGRAWYRRIGQSERLPRAITAGFVATLAMTFTFLIGYGLSLALAKVNLVSYQKGDVFSGWFHSLAHNAVVDLATSTLYVAILVHFSIGLLWAIVYAYLFEQRLSGTGWQRGSVFSLMPWVLSLVLFLPLVGGGLFGVATGAGPLPTIGNLILHLIYGATLGAMYNPVAKYSMEEGEMCEVDRVVELRSWRTGAVGVAVGLLLGALLGWIAAYSPSSAKVATSINVNPMFFVVALVLVGGSWGGVIGSLGGLAVKHAKFH